MHKPIRADREEDRAVYFVTPVEFGEWLKDNPGSAKEIWVGFYKAKSGKRGITYEQALDAALCYGWTDAVRKSIDGERWMIRFTQRKPGSIWSLVNVRRAEELIRLGLMKPAGLKAFNQRREGRTGIYSYEQGAVGFSESFEKEFKASRKLGISFASRRLHTGKPLLTG